MAAAASGRMCPSTIVIGEICDQTTAHMHNRAQFKHHNADADVWYWPVSASGSRAMYLTMYAISGV